MRRWMPLFATLAGGVVLGVLLAHPRGGMSTAILAIAAPLGALVVIKRPILLFPLFLFAAPIKSVVNLPFDLTLLAALGLVAAAVLRVGRRGFPPMRPAVWAFLALVFLVVIGAVQSMDIPYGVDKAARFATFGTISVLAPLFLLDTEKSRRDALMSFVTFGAVASAGALLQGGNIGEFGRYTILGANTIQTGRIAALGLAGAVAALLVSRESLAWAAPLAILSLAATVGSGSRGPAMAIAAGVVVLLLSRLSTRGGRRVLSIAVAVAVVVLSARLWAYLPSASLARFDMLFSESQGASVSARVGLIGLAWSLMSRDPLLGVGTGGFAAFTPLDYPHNFMLELAVENGILGLGLMLGSLLAAIRAVVGEWRHRPGFVPYMTFLMLIASIVNASVSGDINDNRLLYFSMSLALTFGSAQAVGEDQELDSAPRPALTEAA